MYLMCCQIVHQTNEHSIAALNRNPIKYVRKDWSAEQNRFSDAMFYRLFRMPRGCFHQLCQRIETKIGKKSFKSEMYLKSLDEKIESNRDTQLHHARKKTVGSTISGEWKLAITLRMMAGATYLDMYLWSNISPSQICRIFSDVTKNWINMTLDINVYDEFFANDEVINQTVHDF